MSVHFVCKVILVLNKEIAVTCVLFEDPSESLRQLVLNNPIYNLLPTSPINH